MNDLDKDIRFNAQMVEDHAESVADAIDGDEFVAAYMALDALMEYARRLMRNLEARDDQEAS